MGFCTQVVYLDAGGKKEFPEAKNRMTILCGEHARELISTNTCLTLIRNVCRGEQAEDNSGDNFVSDAEEYQ